MRQHSRRSSFAQLLAKSASRRPLWRRLRQLVKIARIAPCCRYLHQPDACSNNNTKSTPIYNLNSNLLEEDLKLFGAKLSWIELNRVASSRVEQTTTGLELVLKLSFLLAAATTFNWTSIARKECLCAGEASTWKLEARIGFKLIKNQDKRRLAQTKARIQLKRHSQEETTSKLVFQIGRPTTKCLSAHLGYFLRVKPIFRLDSLRIVSFTCSARWKSQTKARVDLVPVNDATFYCF